MCCSFISTFGFVFSESLLFLSMLILSFVHILTFDASVDEQCDEEERGGGKDFDCCRFAVFSILSCFLLCLMLTLFLRYQQ